MITISLIGGLGNQMFQYAAGKALAERHGVALSIDGSGFRDYKDRSFLLHKLNVPETPSDSVHPNAIESRIGSHFSRAKWRQRADRILLKAGVRGLPAPANSYREPYFHFDRRFEVLGPETSLFGYFQSELYFKSIAEKLTALFSPRDQFGEIARVAADRIAGSARPVSIHIRRGDYMQASTASVHGLLDESYYRKALALMEASLGGNPFDLFVFSDDLDQAAQVLDFVPPARIHYVRSDPERPWEDMALMARCQHQIIANSSFSWWGAWLNKSPGKTVIAPRRWFAPAALRERNTCDLYPAGWILA